MSNDLAVQPAIVIFDKGRAEACGVAPVGVADPTFFAPVTKTQREAGGVRALATNDAGEMVAPDGTVGGVPVGAAIDQLTGVIKNSFGAALLPVQQPDDIGFDIVLCAGQSNMAGRAPINTVQDWIDQRVFQYGCYSSDATTYQKIGQMTEPLKGPDGTLASGRTGPAPAFARAYATMIPQNRRVLLVHVAVGGTSMVGGTPTWNPGNPGGTNYENAIAKANEAIVAAQQIYPDSRFVGTIWIQGETDGDNSISKSAYTAALTNLIAGFRSRITDASQSWFVIGGMVPEAISAHAGYPSIRDAHIDVAAVVSKCVYVAGVSGFSSDNLHYTTQPGPRIIGYRMAQAVIAAEVDGEVPVEPSPEPGSAPSNTVLPAISGSTVQGSTLTASNGTWSNTPTSYSYQWKRGGSDIAGATNSTYSSVSADIGENITVAVTASNASGSASATSSAVGPITTSGGGSATTYNFESDTVGQPPANVTVLVGAAAVVDSGVTGLTGKYLHSTSANNAITDVFEFNNLVPASPDQTVTWKRSQTSGGARDGMLLRPQAGTSAQGYPSANAGYAFQTSAATGQLRIYKLQAGVAATQIGSSFALVIGNYTHYRASVIGTTLLFEYSADGVTWNTGITATDSTFSNSTGKIQYINGFATSMQSTAYIDDISLS